MRTALLTAALLLGAPAWCQHRSSLDSLEVRVLTLLGPAPDSAEASIATLHTAAIAAADPDSAVRAGYLRAALLERRGRLPEAWRAILAVDALPVKSAAVRVQVKNMLGRIAYSNDEFETALKAYHDLLSYPITDSTRLAVTLNNLARVHERMKEPVKAAEALERSVLIYERLGDRFRLTGSLINLSVAQYGMERYDDCERNTRRSLALAQELGLQDEESIAWENLGNVQRETGDHIAALDSYLRALDLCERTRSLEGITSVHRNIGELQVVAGAPARAVPHLEKALALADSMGSRNYAMDAHLLLSRAMGDLSRNGEALLHLQAYNAIKDSVFSEEKRNALAGWNARLGLLEKERVILEQQVKAEQDRLAVEESRRVTRFAVIGAFALLLLLGLLLRDRLRARRLNEARVKTMEQERTIAVMGAVIEGEERERQRVAAELHDGIGVMLGSARLHLDRSDEDARTKAGELIADAGREVRRVSHALMPGTLAKLGLVEALQELADGINGAGRMRVEVHAHGLKERLPQNTEAALYRIAQEAVNNTLKHANATRCTIDLSMEDDGQRLQLVLEDDGHGLAQGNGTASGHGLLNIRTRAMMLGGSSDLRSAPGKGTSWTIDIPLSPST
ncbi:MAG: tetratricopeptide repeat protein [Flavobacteriales bacterium]|nr:tetratricopeptide repeat protein [Flavobacteriales bacterium]